MTAWRSWVLAGLLVACGGGQRPGPTPAPTPTDTPEPAAAPVTAAAPVADSTPMPAQRADSLAADSLEPAVVDPDSAADAAILEQLATSHPEPLDSGADDGAASTTPGGANAAGGEVTYDIDVETYGTHARVQYYLDFFQGPARERMNVWLQRMPRYEPMIRAKLRENSVPEDMVYLALIESGYSNTAVSRARATGMWQFMKGTAKLYGLRIDSWVDERRDPVRATDAAARHLADLRDRFGSMYLAAAAYNAGAGKVGRGPPPAGRRRGRRGRQPRRRLLPPLRHAVPAARDQGLRPQAHRGGADRQAAGEVRLRPAPRGGAAGLRLDRGA
ncbi:MAG: lytic transglycosylase domain-containing protein [Gemmatimonadetes bacterium]|nr:lytic transglycosylase domain-containing protein [Gemmatimonadota bacterium]